MCGEGVKRRFRSRGFDGQVERLDGGVGTITTALTGAQRRPGMERARENGSQRVCVSQKGEGQGEATGGSWSKSKMVVVGQFKYPWVCSESRAQCEHNEWCLETRVRLCVVNAGEKPTRSAWRALLAVARGFTGRYGERCSFRRSKPWLEATKRWTGSRGRSREQAGSR